MRPVQSRRRRAVGAELTARGVDVRVWAPDRRRASIVIGNRDVALEPESGGYFRGMLEARAGTRYKFRLDDEADSYPDPASRFQPEGPHGDSIVVDPTAYRWRDDEWRGPDRDRLILYEMHVGTFTQEGTWSAAATHLTELRDIGINAIEVMPVNEFGGTFGWGYDGVDLWAPTRLYGTPDDFRAFVDAAHAQQIAVILDVVYNHLGPDGCYLRKFTDAYFTDRYENEWGDALNFDGEGCEGVREFITENAAYWIDEYHLDGLRVDATQSIFDTSREHILSVIARAVRTAAGDRTTFVVAENEPQHVVLLERYGFDAMWNDDWHHCAMVAATGLREAYYTDYRGAPQEFVSMAKSGFLYQGQRYMWQKKRRGTASGAIAPRRFVAYLQNHDQIANSARGARIDRLTSPGRYRALTALLVLAPHTPMLFQGQEFASSAPFLYFADHDGELAEAVAKGRRDFLSQFPSIAAVTAELRAPHERSTFTACKLDHHERETHREALLLYGDLIALRQNDDAFRGRVDGAVIAPDAFVLRYINEAANDRLLVVNLGPQLQLEVIPEPLLASPAGSRWEILWSTESAEYGGAGTPAVETAAGFNVPAQSAVVLAPRPVALEASPAGRSGADDQDR